MKLKMKKKALKQLSGTQLESKATAQIAGGKGEPSVSRPTTQTEPTTHDMFQ